MTELVFIGDIVEKNGRTIKENNLEIKHSISIGTLVETKSDSNYGWEGMRLFVTKHTRDCDGSPLYSLGDNEKSLIYGFGEENLLALMPVVKVSDK